MDCINIIFIHVGVLEGPDISENLIYPRQY